MVGSFTHLELSPQYKPSAQPVLLGIPNKSILEQLSPSAAKQAYGCMWDIFTIMSPWTFSDSITCYSNIPIWPITDILKYMTWLSAKVQSFWLRMKFWWANQSKLILSILMWSQLDYYHSDWLTNVVHVVGVDAFSSTSVLFRSRAMSIFRDDI